MKIKIDLTYEELRFLLDCIPQDDDSSFTSRLRDKLAAKRDEADNGKPTLSRFTALSLNF